MDGLRVLQVEDGDVSLGHADDHERVRDIERVASIWQGYRPYWGRGSGIPVLDFDLSVGMHS
jgi:hypothetical protein